MARLSPWLAAKDRKISATRAKMAGIGRPKRRSGREGQPNGKCKCRWGFNDQGVWGKVYQTCGKPVDFHLEEETGRKIWHLTCLECRTQQAKHFGTTLKTAKTAPAKAKPKAQPKAKPKAKPKTQKILTDELPFPKTEDEQKEVLRVQQIKRLEAQFDTLGKQLSKLYLAS